MKTADTFASCRIAETQTVDKQQYISGAIFSLFTNNYLAYTLKFYIITLTLSLELTLILISFSEPILEIFHGAVNNLKQWKTKTAT